MDKEEQAEATRSRPASSIARKCKLVDLAPGYKGERRRTAACCSPSAAAWRATRINGTEAGDLSIKSDAMFGPNLSDIAAKLVPTLSRNCEARRRPQVADPVDRRSARPQSAQPDAGDAPDAGRGRRHRRLAFQPGPGWRPGPGWVEIKVDAAGAETTCKTWPRSTSRACLSKREWRRSCTAFGRQLEKFRKDPKDVSDE